MLVSLIAAPHVKVYEVCYHLIQQNGKHALLITQLCFSKSLIGRP